MILADTSVWIDHFRSGNRELADLLNRNLILVHPFVIGELACGNLKNRVKILSLLADMPATKVATDNEVLYFIEQAELMGKGIGYIDAHLLAAVSLSSPARLWTRDKKLKSIAHGLHL